MSWLDRRHLGWCQVSQGVVLVQRVRGILGSGVLSEEVRHCGWSLRVDSFLFSSSAYLCVPENVNLQVPARSHTFPALVGL